MASVIDQFPGPTVRFLIDHHCNIAVASTVSVLSILLLLDELKTMLQRVTEAKDARSRLSHQAKLEELITFTQFANDEGDYGQGLELGLDLLAFHPTGLLLSSASCLDGMITALLSTGYFLAGRSKFASVVQKHMKNRPATHVLTIEDVTKNKD